MSNLARWKFEAIMEEMAEETMYKSMVRAKTRKTKNEEKARHKELSSEYKCALRKVHEKSLSNRKPKYEGPTLEEALAEYYG